jgi:hypothetical protein
MRALLLSSILFSTSLLSGNTWALSYEYTNSVCAEVVIQDKVTRNCSGHAEFKDNGSGKFSMNVQFKVGDFEIADNKTKRRYDRNIKANEQKEITFRSPEFTAKEWTDKLKGIFQLINAELIIGEDRVALKDSMLIKKKLGEEVSYQIESIVPLDKATFINLPRGLKGTRTFHLTLVVPETEIKGTKF